MILRSSIMRAVFGAFCTRDRLALVEMGCLALACTGLVRAQSAGHTHPSLKFTQQDRWLSRLFGLDELAGIAGNSSVVAGTAPGDPVYTNTINPITSVYTPGLNQRMADDMHLAASGCGVTYYEIGIVGLCNLQSCPPFDVTVALWDGDPCNPNSQMITGTQEVFSGVPRDNIPKIGSTTFDTPIAIPDDVWMSATFSHANAGWLVGGPAELGSTQNIFSENDTTQGCDQFFLQSNYAGFWAEIRCELAEDSCGDGEVQAGEQCDDGNTVGGDGCSATCQSEICGNAICETGETSCNCPGDCGSTSSAACGNGTCEAGDGEDCRNCPADCNGKQYGTYSTWFCCGAGGGVNPVDCSDLRCSTNWWTCTTASVNSCCGDGILSPSLNEACDDGNNDNCDGCRGDCSTLESTCGDGALDSVCEDCDDANALDGDGCSASCRLEPLCGDGVLDSSEDCDDGNNFNGDGCSSSCQVQDCGDGVLDPGEQCDDGNRENGDGCDAVCFVEFAGSVPTVTESGLCALIGALGIALAFHSRRVRTT